MVICAQEEIERPVIACKKPTPNITQRSIQENGHTDGEGQAITDETAQCDNQFYKNTLALDVFIR